MTRPTLKVEVAFDTKPTEAATWTDVTEYLRGPLTITRGRQKELDQIQCGSAELVLDNRDRRFDPYYDLGPYYGKLLPMRRVRISATAPDGETYWPVFTGYVESWTPETYVDSSRDSVVHVQLVDGFEPLARAMLNGAYAQQTSGARISKVLDDANWTTGISWVVGSSVNGRVGSMIVGPVGDRAISDGVSVIVAQELEGVAALQHCLDIASAEGGWFFVDKAGVVTFYDRHRLLKHPFRDARFEFGSYDALDGLDYSSIVYSYGSEWIYNEVSAQTIDGDTQRVIDESSKLKYFRRTLEESNLPLVDDGEALSRARFLLDRYKEPQIRFDELGFQGAMPDDVWSALLSLELGDMILVRHLPPTNAPGDYGYWSQESVVQGISHDITETDWRVIMWLAPNHSGDYWIVGESKVGAADMRPAW